MRTQSYLNLNRQETISQILLPFFSKKTLSQLLSYDNFNYIMVYILGLILLVIFAVNFFLELLV